MPHPVWTTHVRHFMIEPEMYTGGTLNVSDKVLGYWLYLTQLPSRYTFKYFLKLLQPQNFLLRSYSAHAKTVSTSMCNSPKDKTSFRRNADALASKQTINRLCTIHVLFDTIV